MKEQKKLRENKISFYFYSYYGLIFLSFGLGLSMEQKIGNKIINGYWFIGLGFILFVLLLINLNKGEEDD